MAPKGIRGYAIAAEAVKLQHFFKADPEYGKGVAQGLGLLMSDAT